MFDLSGRVALVTGAGQGVGAGIARALAAHGAVVAVNDLLDDRAMQIAGEIHDAGGRALPAVADVTDLEAMQGIARHIEAEVGSVDILVNNAGIPPERFPLVPFRQIDPRSWDGLIRLNLYGVLISTYAVLDSMCRRGWGRVITISSEAGRVGVEGGVTIYGASKGGALAFSRNLATEVGRDGVTVNSICLALMESNWVGDDPAPSVSLPVPRLGRPADAGAAVVYLASDEAGWVTGQTLPVAGGYCCV